MAAPIFYSNWPTSVPPPPELSHFHDNFTPTDTCMINNRFTNNNNLQFYNYPINYPTLSSSSSYNINPLATQHQQLLPVLPLPDVTQSFGFGFNHDCYSNPIVPDACDDGELFLMNPVERMQLCSQEDSYSYPVMPDVCSMEGVEPELPPLPEIYDGGSSSYITLPSYGGELGFSAIHGEERSVQMKENGVGRGRISAQSMAARVRRRKISEKTSELGKLVPGGHRMTTAEMFQAGFKYIKFLQAQVGVLQLMQSSPGLGSELQGLLTSPTVQEKLYAAGKCIVSQTLGETLADDHQGTKN